MNPRLLLLLLTFLLVSCSRSDSFQNKCIVALEGEIRNHTSGLTAILEALEEEDFEKARLFAVILLQGLQEEAELIKELRGNDSFRNSQTYKEAQAMLEKNEYVLKTLENTGQPSYQRKIVVPQVRP